MLQRSPLTLLSSSDSDSEHNEIADRDGVYLTTSGWDDRDDSVWSKIFFVLLVVVRRGGDGTLSMEGAPKYVYVVSTTVIIVVVSLSLVV